MHAAPTWKKPARVVAALTMLGACLATSAVVEAPAAAAPLAQATPRPAVTPTPVRPAPRAGGFPVELALPLLAGGGAALGGGLLLLRRGRQA
jgi:hypothetical protein